MLNKHFLTILMGDWRDGRVHTSGAADSIPGDSDGKESACNARDLCSIPGLGRSPGEGNDYPLQWASLIAQSVKNLPAMQEILVQFLDQEDPLEKG